MKRPCARRCSRCPMFQPASRSSHALTSLTLQSSVRPPLPVKLSTGAGKSRRRRQSRTVLPCAPQSSTTWPNVRISRCTARQSIGSGMAVCVSPQESAPVGLCLEIAAGCERALDRGGVERLELERGEPFEDPERAFELVYRLEQRHRELALEVAPAAACPSWHWSSPLPAGCRCCADTNSRSWRDPAVRDLFSEIRDQRGARAAQP